MHEGAADIPMSDLAQRITTLFEQGGHAPRDDARDAFLRLRDELSLGTVRAAEPDASSPTGWIGVKSRCAIQASRVNLVMWLEQAQNVT